MKSGSQLLRAVIVALCVSVSNSASAQISQTRQGFWFNGGLGYRSFGCENCDGREGALSGGRLSTHVVVDSTVGIAPRGASAPSRAVNQISPAVAPGGDAPSCCPPRLPSRVKQDQPWSGGAVPALGVVSCTQEGRAARHSREASPPALVATGPPGIRLTTCASALQALEPAPAQTFVPQRAHGGCRPRGGWRPLGPSAACAG
jgi:hypothetical protein